MKDGQPSVIIYEILCSDSINISALFSVDSSEIVRISLQEIFAELNDFRNAGLCGDGAVLIRDDEVRVIAVFAFGVVHFLVDEQDTVSIAFRISIGIADECGVCS